MFRSKASRRVATIVTAGASAAILALTLASTSSAAVRDDPTPGATPTDGVSGQTVSPNFGYRPPPVVRTQRWQWDVQLSDIAALLVNNVEGQGAIPMNRWRDISISRNIDRFQRGPNSVTLLHDSLPLPDVNLATCTLTFSQPDGRFRILAGTGTGANLRSRNGQFDLLGLVSFPEIQIKKHSRHDGLSVCPLRFFSLGALLRAVEDGVSLRGLPAPTYTNFAVQGAADVFSIRTPVRPPHPYATPSDTSTDILTVPSG